MQWVFFFTLDKVPLKMTCCPWKPSIQIKKIWEGALMILIISIPKAGERMHATHDTHPPPLLSLLVKNLKSGAAVKVQCFNFINPFCVKTLSYVTFNYYLFLLSVQILCTAVCCPDRCQNLIISPIQNFIQTIQTFYHLGFKKFVSNTYINCLSDFSKSPNHGTERLCLKNHVVAINIGEAKRTSSWIHRFTRGANEQWDIICCLDCKHKQTQFC